MLFKTRLRQLVLYRKHPLNYSALNATYRIYGVLRSIYVACIVPRIRQQNVYLYRRQQTFIVLSTAILKYIYIIYLNKSIELQVIWAYVILYGF